jgi:hypothetical protein
MKFSAVFVFFALISTALATPTNGNDLARRRVVPEVPEGLIECNTSGGSWNDNKCNCPRPDCINIKKCNDNKKICVVRTPRTKTNCGLSVLVQKTQTYCDSLDTKCN